MTIPLLIVFTAENNRGCTNEAVTGANKAPRNPPSCFFLFHVFLLQ